MEKRLFHGISVRDECTRSDDEGVEIGKRNSHQCRDDGHTNVSTGRLDRRRQDFKKAFFVWVKETSMATLSASLCVVRLGVQNSSLRLGMGIGFVEDRILSGFLRSPAYGCFPRRECLHGLAFFLSLAAGLAPVHRRIISGAVCSPTMACPASRAVAYSHTPDQLPKYWRLRSI